MRNLGKNLAAAIYREVNVVKIRSIVVCAIAMAVCLWGVAYGDEIIYSESFDGFDNGDLLGQGGWESIDALSGGLGSLTVQSDFVLKGVGKALKAEAFQENHIKWAIPVESGVCYLSIFFSKADAGSNNTLHIYMGKGALAWSAGPVIRIGSQAGDPAFIGIHDGNDATIVQAAKFNVGEWNHLRAVVDVDSMKFEAYLDGKSIGKFGFRNASHNAIEWLMIGFDEGIDLLGYYDSIEFGTGTGEGAYTRAISVEPEDKLSTTWGTVKTAY